jgi:tRNA(Ile)-lysidine synthase
MVEEIENIVKKWEFLKDKEIYIACSAGLDSTVLAHIFARVSNSCTLLHVNYNLRGEESHKDELFVRELAEKLNISAEINSIQTLDILSKKKQNIQLFARNFRYEWFAEFIKNKNAVLLLGHHFDDQIETFYLNLARKSGNLGMACMLETHGQLLRPFLDFSKNDLKNYALSKSICWREDSSNSSNKYARNRLRNEFIPYLLEKIPSLKESIQLLIKQFQSEVKEIHVSIEEIRDSIVKNGTFEFSIYNSLNIEQKITLLKHFNYNSKQLPEIEKLKNASKGKIISSKTHIFINEKDHFVIRDRNLDEKIPQLLIEKCEKLPSFYSKKELYVDKVKIKGELNIRKWKEGDRISSLGLKGSQLISDIIKDAKITTLRKQNVFVIEDESAILWCYGLKISRIALANENSKEILKIMLKTD